VEQAEGMGKKGGKRERWGGGGVIKYKSDQDFAEDKLGRG